MGANFNLGFHFARPGVMHLSGSSLNTFPSTLTGPLKYLHIGTFWWKTLNDWRLLQCYHFENGEEAFNIMSYRVHLKTVSGLILPQACLKISYFKCTRFAVCSCRLLSLFKRDPPENPDDTKGELKDPAPGRIDWSNAVHLLMFSI